MSTLALQRALVRMLYDPLLVSRVHADAAAALADTELDASQRALLVAWDPRAFLTDPERRTRTLAALLEEYPAACMLLLAQARGTAPLHAFFSSPLFHACVQRGDALALAFGEYLVTLTVGSPPRTGAWSWLGRLEHAIAAARRSASPPPDDGYPLAGSDCASNPAVRLPSSRLRLAPGVMVQVSPSGTLACKQALGTALAARLAERPGPVAEAIVQLAADGIAPATAAEGEEHLLIHARAEAGSPAVLEQIPAELARVLTAARPGIAPSVLLGLLRAEGAAQGEDERVLASLVADGLLAFEVPPAGSTD